MNGHTSVIFIPTRNNIDWSATVSNATTSMDRTPHDFVFPKPGTYNQVAKDTSGDVIVVVYGPCKFKDQTLARIALLASQKLAIVPAAVRDGSEVGYGGYFSSSSTGLEVQSCPNMRYRTDALAGPVFAIRKDVLATLGWFPDIPPNSIPCLTALSLAAWFSGVPIFVSQQSICVGEPIPCDSDRNVLHAVFFPHTYETYWKPKLEASILPSSKELQVFRAPYYRSRIRTEQQFFDDALHTDYPDIDTLSYVTQQASKSQGKHYHSGERRMRKAFEWMLKKRGSRSMKGLSYLDIGCRDGASLEIATKLRAKSTCGIDLVPASVEYAKSVGRNAFIGDARKLPLDSNAYDIVSCIHALEHIPQPSIALKEMVRVCVPGGLIFIVVPREDILPTSHKVFAHHVFFGNEQQLRNFVLDYVDPTSVITAIGNLHRGHKEIRLLARARQ
jgi:ubiquinone/menaquinone biosynthesis C-methylase UbiE